MSLYRTLAVVEHRRGLNKQDDYAQASSLRVQKYCNQLLCEKETRKCNYQLCRKGRVHICGFDSLLINNKTITK